MINNPEFRRNLWLEVTPARLIIMAFVLFAIFSLSYISDDYHLGETTAGTAKALFIVISMIWGTKQASESVMNEIKDHTWDWQRMSIITPWELTTGKLFGSTVYTWFGAVICLFMIPISSGWESLFPALRTSFALLFSGMFAHATSLLASMVALQKDRKYIRGQTSAFLVLGIMASIPFFTMSMKMQHDKIEWFIWSLDRSDFMLCTLFCYTAWAVLGINRLMRSELQMKNMPWVWFCFVFFNMIYAAGLFNGPQTDITSLDAVSHKILAAFMVAVTTSYFMVFSEKKDFLTLNTLKRMVMESKWKSFLEHSPRWLLTLPIAVITGIALVLFSLAEGKPSIAIWLVTAGIFFMLRDICIIVFCNIGNSNKRADITAVVCLGLLYGLFPLIFQAMKTETLTLFFWPRTDLNPVMGAVFSMLEFIVIGTIVAMRWQKQPSFSGSVSKPQ